MLTMILVSDGDPQDGQQAISISYNTGLAVKVVDKNGVELGSVSAVGTNEPEPAVADEPHPVFEKEVEPTPAPVTETTDAPAVTE